MFIRHRRWAVAASLAIGTSWAVAAGAQRPQTNLPLDPPRERGASITPAYEGWYANPDGTLQLAHRLLQPEFEGSARHPDRAEQPHRARRPDQGQPTYFEVGRQWGVFVIKVPKDFGTKTITWTHGVERRDADDSLHPEQGLPDQLRIKELGMGNQPPVLAFSQGGAKVTGPPVGVSTSFTATVNQPVGDQRLGGGSKGAPKPRRRRRHSGPSPRWRPCRFTSSVGPEK